MTVTRFACCVLPLGLFACTGDDGATMPRAAPAAPRMELAAVTGGAPSTASPLLGRSAPAIEVRTPSGRDALAFATTGTPLVLHFWATWCEPCKRTMRALDALAAQRAGQVRVIGLSVDDEPDGVEAFARTYGVRFPVGWDRGLVTANRYQPATMPTTYVIDGSGVVRYVLHGYADGDEVELARQVSLLTPPR